MNRNLRSAISSGIHPETIIRSSALGELVSMLMAAIGLMGGIAWVPYLGQAPIGLVLVISGIWMGMRSAGGGSRSRITPLLTLALLSGTVAVMTSYLSNTPRWLTNGPAAPGVFLLLLGMQLLIDLGDLWKLLSPQWNGEALQHWNWKRITLWSLFLVVGIYLVLIPAVSSLWESINPPKTRSSVLEELTFAEQVRIRTTAFVVAGWFFTLGAIIGSYLNVVVYRLPRRESLIGKPSSCPQCDHRIETRDNIPVLGWLLLNGRCRHCQSPISARYPIVEFLTGSLFLLLYHVELISGGANLPVREPNHYTGVVWVIFYTKWDLIAYYLYHCFLLCVLWTWFLIAYDGNTVPLRSAARMLLLALLAVLLWPGLQLVPVWPGGDRSWSPTRIEGIITALTGTLAGGLLGSLVWWRFRQFDPFLPTFIIVAFAITGTAFGWQATLATTLLLLLFQLVWKAIGPEFRISVTAQLMGSLLLASLVTLLLWRMTAIHLHRWWPGPSTTGGDATLWCLILAALLFLTERVSGRKARTTAKEESPSRLSA
ncbi:MAG TPA: prepilin peptidase [Planctomicrobium sp.]|nr:prepilin peptidase [Planctomicrobium sp.]